MSAARQGGRGNKFWDARRLKSLRALKAQGAEYAVMRERFGVAPHRISEGMALLAEEDAAKAAGGGK